MGWWKRYWGGASVERRSLLVKFTFARLCESVGPTKLRVEESLKNVQVHFGLARLDV
jgi:hypothetical protein